MERRQTRSVAAASSIGQPAMSGGGRGAALVTGAARRIGLAIATRLAEAGFDVVLHASERSRDETERAAGELAKLGVKTGIVAGDLASPVFCGTLIARSIDAVGPLRLLVNNASVFEADSADSFDSAAWDRHFAVNLRAPVILAQDMARRASGETDTSIVNVIDQRVLRPTPQFFSYTLAKSALWTATRTMAQAFAERSVRINAVGPGPVLPNATDGDAGFTKEVEGVPLQRAVDPSDIAEAVRYLADARAVTGQMLAVDAGQHLGWRTPDVVD